MQLKKTKKIILIAFALVAIIAVFVGFLMFPNIKTQATVIEINNAVDGSVALNTEIDIPSSITVDYNGTQNATDGVVVCPDGKIVGASKMTLNQAGVYQLKYFFKYNGIQYTAIQKVEVYSEFFELSNPTGGEIIVTDDTNKLYCGKDGVIANLKSGTSFVYNKVVDLREVDEDGLSNIIELDTRYGHVDDQGNYVPEVDTGWVRLTDCYNPNIYMELRMQRSVNYMGCLFPGVRTSAQPVVGMDKGVDQVLTSTNRIITLDGSIYRVWIKEGSMSVGMYDIKTSMNTGAQWKYDMKTNRVYLTYNNRDKVLVTDLDEPLIYDDAFFPGFTTGEVFVSIYAEGYDATYAQTEIVSIGNDMLKDVANQKYVDTVVPQLTVEQNKTTPTGVYGAVGDVFTIPSVKVTDVNLVEGVDVAVYRNYGTTAQTNVSVVDGKFNLSTKAEYTIVYEAKDKMGNKGVTTFTVTAIDTPDNRAITLNTIDEKTIDAGKKVEDLFEVTNAINVDEKDVQVKVFVENEKQKIDGEGLDFTFTPYYEGQYKIRFEYSDGVFNYQKEVTINCQRSETSCFMDKVLSPKYYLQGYTYAIDNISAYTFVNGYPEKTKTDIFVVYDDSGERQKIENPDEVTITGNSNVYFIYEAENGETLVTEKTDIINADYYNASGKKLGFDMSKFFIGDFTANATDGIKRVRNITFTSNLNSGNNTLSYFNQIMARKFVLEYKLVAGQANFGTLRINLTDAKNSLNKLYFDVVNGDDGTYVSVNGGNLTKVETLKFENAINTISYDYESKFLRIGEYATSVEFDANSVYLDIQMLDIVGKSSIVISAINNTTIAGNNYVDGSSPEIYVNDYQGDYQVGDIVKIAIPEYADVISGINYSKASVMITCDDRGVVYDANGKALSDLQVGQEYEVKLDRIAKFYAIYEIYDFAGIKTTKTILLNCADSTAPTVTLNNIKDGKVLKVKADEKIQINFTVADDVTIAKNLIVYIHLYCKDMYSYVPNVTGISPEEAPENGVYKEYFYISIAGNYQAQINVQDEQGNLLVKRIEIVVE